MDGIAFTRGLGIPGCLSVCGNPARRSHSSCGYQQTSCRSPSHGQSFCRSLSSSSLVALVPTSVLSSKPTRSPPSSPPCST
ncbi:hypothetical protein C8Q80DRAFT_1186552 [Daedaleopsis nitida]|nr:hypothetical protein C8Q80DRAFT_1186552 [Daedaleopsis nitida]